MIFCVVCLLCTQLPDLQHGPYKYISSLISQTGEKSGRFNQLVALRDKGKITSTVFYEENGGCSFFRTYDNVAEALRVLRERVQKNEVLSQAARSAILGITGSTYL